MSRSIAALTALALAAAPVAGQVSQSVDAMATVTIAESFLSLVNIRGLNFGTHFSSEGTITTGEANFAQWDGSTGAGSRISIAFTGLPSHLIQMVAGTGQTLPITYGTASGISEVFTTSERFNPFHRGRPGRPRRSRRAVPGLPGGGWRLGGVRLGVREPDGCGSRDVPGDRCPDCRRPLAVTPRPAGWGTTAARVRGPRTIR